MNALKQRKIVPHPTKPIGGLMDDRFVYVRSENTDIRKTFQRVIDERKKKERKL